MTDCETPLTRHQAAVIGAYTGIVVGPFSDIHEYAERKIGRPIWIHEFAGPELTAELRLAARDDLLAIVYCPSPDDGEKL